MRCWPVVVMFALAHVGFVHADGLDEARTAVDNSDYEAARTALDKALASGTAGPEELAEIYKLTGIVDGALGETAEAATAFSKWLALDPKGTLPPGTSPKIGRPYKTASDQAKKKKPFEVKADTVALPPTVTLVIVSDPMQLVGAARVFVVADGKPAQQLEGKPGDPIELPHGGRLDLRVQALDDKGNRVFELGSTSVPLVITGAETEDEHRARISGQPVHVVAPKRHDLPPPAPRPWYFQWWVWGAATATAGVVTLAFGFETHSDLSTLDQLNRNSLDHVFGDAQSTESSARRDLLVTDIAAITTGVFAVGTAVFYLTRPRVLEHVPVAAVPMRDGGAVVLGGHF